jgi:hypothetical protein
MPIRTAPALEGAVAAAGRLEGGAGEVMADPADRLAGGVSGDAGGVRRFAKSARNATTAATPPGGTTP